MASNFGSATITFDSAATDAVYESVQVVTDVPAHGNRMELAWKKLAGGSASFSGCCPTPFGLLRLSGAPNTTSQTMYTKTGNSAAGSLAFPNLGQTVIAYYGNGLMVGAYAGATSIRTSPADGVWTSRTSPLGISWSAGCYGGGVHVVLASGSSSYIYSTDNTVTWNAGTLPSSSSWNSLAYTNGYFVAHDTATTCVTSPDGINWTTQTGATHSANVVVGGNSVFLSTDGTTVYRSTDNGVSWNVVPGISGQAIAFGDGTFVSLNSGGFGYASYDGLTWGTIAVPSLNNCTSASTQYCPGHGFISVDTQFDQAFNWSPDGWGGELNTTPVTRTVSTVNRLVSPAYTSPGSNFTTTTVTGQSEIVATDNVDVWIQGNDSTADHNSTEHQFTPIRLVATNIVPNVGFDILAFSEYRVRGDFKVRWAWSS